MPKISAMYDKVGCPCNHDFNNVFVTLSPTCHFQNMYQEHIVVKFVQREVDAKKKKNYKLISDKISLHAQKRITEKNYGEK